MYHMTGNFFTDYTYGSRSLLMNLKSCSWDERLLELMEIDKEKLCELKAPGSIMGSTTKKFAEETGILEGVPVISAGGDQQCGMLGQGVVEHGDVSLTLGTGGFLLTACREIPQHLDWDVVCNASSVSGEYILEVSMLTCTLAMEWFKQNFYREALMVGAVAMKEYRTIKEAFSVIRDGAKRKEYQVRKENHVVYEKIKEETEEIYQKMQEKRRI